MGRTKNKDSWGKYKIEAEGVIHCLTVEYFWRVASNFIAIEDELVLVCINENKLKSEVKYEDGTYKKNPEFDDIEEI